VVEVWRAPRRRDGRGTRVNDLSVRGWWRDPHQARSRWATSSAGVAGLVARYLAGFAAPPPWPFLLRTDGSILGAKLRSGAARDPPSPSTEGTTVLRLAIWSRSTSPCCPFARRRQARRLAEVRVFLQSYRLAVGSQTTVVRALKSHSCNALKVLPASRRQ
jgi:hypothetical protein